MIVLAYLDILITVLIEIKFSLIASHPGVSSPTTKPLVNMMHLGPQRSNPVALITSRSMKLGQVTARSTKLGQVTARSMKLRQVRSQVMSPRPIKPWERSLLLRKVLMMTGE